jgi:hypothetical protein
VELLLGVLALGHAARTVTVGAALLSETNA